MGIKYIDLVKNIMLYEYTGKGIEGIKEITHMYGEHSKTWSFHPSGHLEVYTVTPFYRISDTGNHISMFIGDDHVCISREA